MCGKCCYMEIPLTLLDIKRIADYKNVRVEKIFKEVTQNKISNRSSLFKISKNENQACIFLAKDQSCSIHPAKPNVCQFYNCSFQPKTGEMPWTALYKTSNQRAKLWEQTVAAQITKVYIEKNNNAWNEKDFKKALNSIRQNIKINDNQKLKLGRASDGSPVAMLYNCENCDQRGVCASETIITIDDIHRICAQYNIDPKIFFKKYIDDDKSSTGSFKLKRDKHCILYDIERQECKVGEVKPFHCRFRPCPNRTKNSEMMDALFLGSGTVKEQFRHQVALAITREYIATHQTNYQKNRFSESLSEIDSVAKNPIKMKEFLQSISRFRYVDDTLIKEQDISNE